ncbi:MAG TPA: nuclear transport factor 2 family protein [Tepidisphaeraceae bacterium]|nr:nuclear transport factor 2 family protein [Tepidisphaeraceae bacterium]
MRRWSLSQSMMFAACLTRVAAAPATTPAPDGAGAMAMAEAYVAAWNAHDAGAAVALLADDVVYYDAAVGRTVRGRAAVRDVVIAPFFTAVPDARWSMNADADPVVADDAVVFQWTLAGTNTGPWADGQKATDRPFTFGGATIVKVHDGRITYVGHFYDSYGFFKQLGLAK